MGLVANAEFYNIYDVIYPNTSNLMILKQERKLYYNYKLYTMFDSRNSSILPTKGNRFYANIKIHTDNFINYKNTFPPVSFMLINERTNVLSKRFTLLQNQAFRFIITDSLPPMFLRSFLGGELQTDLYEYQLPFQGLRFAEVIAENVGLLGFGLRYNLYKKNYVSLLTNIAATFDYLKMNDNIRYIVGAGINYTYLSLLGPLQCTLGYSNQNKTLVSFISLGFRF